MINKEQHIGKIYSSKNYGSFIIADYDGCERVTIRFLTTQYETVASLDNIRIGNVRDKLVPSVFGGGVVGDEVIMLGDKYIKEYYLWRGMLRRCYDEKYIEKKHTYKGCTVSENFKSFKYFKEWCNKQIGFDQDGWHLDKDILVKGNKIYSEDTCCFVPCEINVIFTDRSATKGEYPVGVYYNKSRKKYVARVSKHGCLKHIGIFTSVEEAVAAYNKEKESHIKDVANIWKDDIDPRVYNVMVNYSI